eukprot:RCo007084
MAWQGVVVRLASPSLLLCESHGQPSPASSHLSCSNSITQTRGAKCGRHRGFASTPRPEMDDLVSCRCTPPHGAPSSDPLIDPPPSLKRAFPHSLSLFLSTHRPFLGGRERELSPFVVPLLSLRRPYPQPSSSEGTL